MIKVVTLYPSASPQGTLDAEKCIELEDVLAQGLIDAGGAKLAPEGATVNGTWPHPVPPPPPAGGSLRGTAAAAKH